MATVVVNCVDVDAEVAFWSEMLGVGERNRVDGFFVWLEPQQAGGVALTLQEVDEPTPGRRRLHLDLEVADLIAARADLEDLGATHVEDHDIEGVAWTVMADPEGNEFCIAAHG